MRRAVRPALVTTLAICSAALVHADSAGAHAFGARYDLPLPLDMYLLGAGAAVALSFVIVAMMARVRRRALPSIRLDLRGRGAVWAHVCATIAGVASVGLLILIVAAGLAGNPSPVKNLAPVMVWVLWWVGFVFVTALVANFWVVLNPWDAVARWVGRAVESIKPARQLPVARAYPEHLGAWPAVCLFAGFAWLELVSPAGEHPATLAWLVIAYCALTWSGCAVFGREVWMTRGDVFCQVLGIYARLAPLRIERSRADAPACIVLRPYAAGLAQAEVVSWSTLILVLTMLSTVSFDGFMETSAWQAIIAAIETSQWLRPSLLVVQGMGVNLLQCVKTIALLVGILAFFSVYVAFVWVAVVAGRRRVQFTVLCRALVVSLVPIAVAYHVAHYLSYLMLAGQLIIPLASDPFAIGWDLFGTASYTIDISVIDARTVWNVAMVAIVAGHVVAVFVAHMIALRLYGEPRDAILSQLPITVLMVLYTMASLWILAQPVVAL